ncbi:hypothetical protein CGCVW01_v010591, partial [Colletotrichum viniferum]
VTTTTTTYTQWHTYLRTVAAQRGIEARLALLCRSDLTAAVRRNEGEKKQDDCWEIERKGIRTTGGEKRKTSRVHARARLAVVGVGHLPKLAHQPCLALWLWLSIKQLMQR